MTETTTHQAQITIASGKRRDLVAAELAIGPQARPAPAISTRRDVQAWTARLTPLLVEAPSIPPGADVWPRIAARIAPSVSTPARQSGSIWRSLPFWRSLAFGGIGLTAASLVVLFGATDVLLRPQTPPRQQLVAVIGPSDVSALFTAVYDPSRSELSVAPIAGRCPRLPRAGALVCAGWRQAAFARRVRPDAESGGSHSRGDRPDASAAGMRWPFRWSPPAARRPAVRQGRSSHKASYGRFESHPFDWRFSRDALGAHVGELHRT